MIITRDELVAAFDEWIRQYNEDSSNFTVGFGDNYGDAAADFLINLLGKNEENN